MEDFKCFFFSNEKVGGNHVPLSKLADFKECVQDYGLIELPSFDLFSIIQTNKSIIIFNQNVIRFYAMSNGWKGLLVWHSSIGEGWGVN